MTELSFILWYKIVIWETSLVEKVVETLNYIWLHWKGYNNVESRFEPSKEIGLVPIDSIKSVVHVV